MRRVTLIRLLAISILVAVVLSSLSFIGLRFFNEYSSYNHRLEFITTLAKQMEQQPFDQAVADYAKSHQGQRGNRNQLWILSDSGNIIATTSNDPLPIPFEELSKPEAIHDFTIKYAFLGLTPDLTTVRLQAPTPVYLVVRLGGRRAPNLLIFAPVALTFLLVALAVFMALSITFYYLQRKSAEAKEVLSRLEKGDLKARFKIQRFDQVGNLMLDFNRMVSEIERLIGRVKETETARRNLLQELGHDLRTPLTSLRTSIETLSTHFEQMPTEDRKEFFGMVDSEFQYFIRLVEDLFFIADLDEPRYKATAAQVDLYDILSSEMKSRQAGRGEKIDWRFTGSDLKGRHAFVLGDLHLILRLFKNALDNAGKFAVSRVEAQLHDRGSEWEVEVLDDGPGITPDELNGFGKRRPNRAREIGPDGHFSLGLGSVIMKTIVELHEGRVEVENLTGKEAGVSNGKSGLRLRIFLPKEIQS